MNILAIETSCDETSLAIVSVKNTKTDPVFTVYSHIISSQSALHEKWGGVVPNLAKREHEKNIVPILLRALAESNITPKKNHTVQNDMSILDEIFDRENELREKFLNEILPLPVPDIDLISVTRGPGLEPALWVGISMARALSYIWGISLIGVNHMEGHVISALIQPINNANHSNSYTLTVLHFPVLALLVSGGHTELDLIKENMIYETLGKTRDDAVGEAYDKVARILELGYPGGPAVSEEAKKTTKETDREPNILLPRPMIHSRDFDFSFSGIKTAVLYMVKQLQQENVELKNVRPIIAKEFQNAVTEVLVAKTLVAAKKYNVRTVLIGGGVAANSHLREQLENEIKKHLSPTITYYFPSSHVTGDNALMIAIAGYLRRSNAKKTVWRTIRPDGRLRLGH